MSDFENYYCDFSIMDVVYDPVISNANSIAVLRPGKFFAPYRAGFDLE